MQTLLAPERVESALSMRPADGLVRLLAEIDALEAAAQPVRPVAPLTGNVTNPAPSQVTRARFTYD